MNRCSTARLRGLAFSLSVLLLGGAAALALPAGAGAAEGIYWTNATTIQSGTVGGSTETAAKTLFETLANPADGIALDPATGKLYWSEPGGNEILDGPIAGEKTAGTALYSTQPDVTGLSINTATGTLYWGEYASGTFSSGPIAPGSSATALTIPAEEGVEGIAVDPTTGKVYWANYETETIMAASLTGSTSEVLYKLPAYPVGVAVDAATGKIYWTQGNGDIEEGVLGGEAATAAVPLYTGEADLNGIAVDPTTGALYWSADNEIVAGSTSGATAKQLYTATNPAGLALLTTPVNAVAPTTSVTGTPAVGSTLTCSTGTWAADLPESQLYRAPASYAYQWLRNGTAVKTSGTSATLKVTEGGTYTCQVTATNAEGPSAAVKSSGTGIVVPAPAPKVSISTPATGQTYTQFEQVATKFSCTEGAGGPGIASCDDSNGIVSTGSGAGILNTATTGSFSYTVTGVSKDGLTTSTTISYTVVSYPAPESLAEVELVSLGKSEKAGKESVKLECNTGPACSGKVTLTTKLKEKAKKGKKSKTVTLALGSASYKLASGKSETLEVKLTSKALTALAQAKKTQVTVDAKATVSGGSAVTLSGKLKLSAAKKSKTKTSKKKGKKATSKS
jgi:PQQ-like domain